MDNFSQYFGGMPWMANFGFWFLPLVIWSLVWKGMALWRAARRVEKGWFVALLIVNTIGILEILYLYVFSKPRATSAPQNFEKKF